MTLQPTLKENKRYLLCEVRAEAPVSKNEAREAIERALLAFLGEKGCSLANPRIVDFWGDRAVLKCERGALQEVRAALAFLKEAGGKKARARVLRVSGTVSKLREKA